MNSASSTRDERPSCESTANVAAGSNHDERKENSRAGTDGGGGMLTPEEILVKARLGYETSKANNDDRQRRLNVFAAKRTAHSINDEQKKKKSSSETDKASNFRPLDESDFIAPALVQFLGVRSLLSFGVTSKSHQAVASREVARRKTFIEEIKVEVERIMVSQKQSTQLAEYMDIRFRSFDFGNPDVNFEDVDGDDKVVEVCDPSRENVIAAKQIVYSGVRLIDDELYNLHKKGNSSLFDFFLLPRDYYFERRHIFRQELVVLWSIDILPLCFYFSPEDEFGSILSLGEIRKACNYSTMVWGDLLQMGFEADNETPESNPLSVGPFPCPFMNSAFRIAQDGLIDAFRIAARECHNEKGRDENVMAALWDVIKSADEFQFPYNDDDDDDDDDDDNDDDGDDDDDDGDDDDDDDDDDVFRN